MVAKLLSKGANVEEVDKWGRTPLMLAASVYSADNYDTAKYLVEFGGANIFKQDSVSLVITSFNLSFSIYHRPTLPLFSLVQTDSIPSCGQSRK